MEDIPQPSDEPYSVGDRVRIYLSSDDPDAQYHDRICEITEVFTNDLDSDTGRELDSYSYKLKDTETEEELPIGFHHRDLVSV